MSKPKTDTITFKQTVSNVQFKKLLKIGLSQGVTVQQVIRDLVAEAVKNTPLGL